MLVAEWNEVIFSGESHICLSHHDGRIRDWRHRGERMRNSCIMHRHTGPATGIMLWGEFEAMKRKDKSSKFILEQGVDPKNDPVKVRDDELAQT
ncbi:transposable element Tc1 transposase [Trichonephila clavipes]|uniref:Transposable element Tc1 transposase n=1 Tax=Trichonephila clavipes TaxID=2585209 RepID=A0A8X6VPS4_TRICX|nr:transposable element Tc1 transposase [Trichonephila clavipes]